MNFITKNKLLIVFAFIVIIFIYFKSETTNEGFNQSPICDSYLKESLNRYPCTSKNTKRYFLDWCNSYRRRLGMFPSLPTAMSRFYRFRETDIMLDSLGDD